MAWAVDPKIARYLESEQWLGRCGSLHLKLPTCDVEDTDNIFIDYFLVGVHAPHDDNLFLKFMESQAAIVASRPKGDKLCLFGDWNTNLLGSYYVHGAAHRTLATTSIFY